MLIVMTGAPPALAVKVDVPLPLQVIGTPFEVNEIVGAVSVTERPGPSISVIANVPLDTSALVVSLGDPVVSGTPLGSPSSETLAVLLVVPNEGASFTAATLTVTVAELETSEPSVTE
jgi:hypothetical protein